MAVCGGPCPPQEMNETDVVKMELSPQQRALCDHVFDAAERGDTLTVYALMSPFLCTDYHEPLPHRPHMIKNILSYRRMDGTSSASGEPPTFLDFTPLMIAAHNDHTNVVRLLLKEFNAPMEEVGVLYHDGYRINNVTALWIAVSRKHLGLVDELINHGANVNHLTDTKSTPLRVACFNRDWEMSYKLLKAGADPNVPNQHGNTCLMLAAYKQEVNIVMDLLKNGADVNQRAKCGSTALHFAVEKPRKIGISDLVLEELLSHTTKIIRNHLNMTPRMVAAYSGQIDCVNSSYWNDDKESEIDAVELLASYFANDKEYNLDLAFECMMRALELRYSDSDNIISKEVLPPIAAYDNLVEFQTVEELASIQDDVRAVQMHGLIMRERILGQNHPGFSHAIMYRGAVFADDDQIEDALKLWSYALSVEANNKRVIYPIMTKIMSLILKMYYRQLSLKFMDISPMIETCINVLSHIDDSIMTTCDESTKTTFETEKSSALRYVVQLLQIASIIDIKPNEDIQLQKLIYQLVKLKKTSTIGNTVLHLAMVEIPHSKRQDYRGVHALSKRLVDSLIKCGVDVNAQNDQGTLALHYIMSKDATGRSATLFSPRQLVREIVDLLVTNGAHVDGADNRAHTPIDMAPRGPCADRLKPLFNMSLQCVAARVIKRTRIPYTGLVPQHLVDFLKFH